MSHTSSIGKALALVGTRLVALPEAIGRPAGCGSQGGCGLGCSNNEKRLSRLWMVTRNWKDYYHLTSTRPGHRRDATSLVAREFDGASSRSLLRVSVTAFSVPRGNKSITCRYTTLLHGLKFGRLGLID